MKISFIRILIICIDIRPFNIRSMKPAVGNTSPKHDAHSTGFENSSNKKKLVLLIIFQHFRFVIVWYKCVGVHY